MDRYDSTKSVESSSEELSITNRDYIGSSNLEATTPHVVTDTNEAGPGFRKKLIMAHNLLEALTFLTWSYYTWDYTLTQQLSKTLDQFL